MSIYESVVWEIDSQADIYKKTTNVINSMTQVRLVITETEQIITANTIANTYK